MGFTYKPLWENLAKLNMSKTELRRLTEMSTATLAKLSADQPVSFEIIAKICENLGCSMEKVIQYENEEGIIVTQPWETIKNEETYIINLFFIVEGERTDYIYGFVTPYLMQGASKIWEMREIVKQGELGTFVIEGSLEGKDIHKVLQSISKGERFNQIIESLKVNIQTKHNKSMERIRDRIREVKLCGDEIEYRPRFVLDTIVASAGLESRYQPMHSYDNVPMCCEAFIGLNKSEIYMIDGKPDVKRMKALEETFKQGLPIKNTINELGRLKNFEVLSYLSDSNNNQGIQVEVVHDKINASGIRLILNHDILQGDFVVNAKAYNAKNIILDRIHTITCKEQDVILKYDILESCSQVEVQVWRLKEKNNSTIDTVIHVKNSCIRDIELSVSVSEREGILKDSWTERKENCRGEKNKKFIHQTTENIKRHHLMNDVWLPEIIKVQNDYREILGEGEQTGIFFSEGWQAHEEFLTWLSRKLQSHRVKHMSLLDPFIDANSISKLVRCIQELNVEYEIITDKKAKGINSSSKDISRIREIEDVCKKIQNIVPNKFQIKALDGNNTLLHDRYLILDVGTHIPEVYVLSNSLDGLAMKHASVIVKADIHVAKQVKEYYVQHIGEWSKKGWVRTLYNTQDKKEEKSRIDLSKQNSSKEKMEKVVKSINEELAKAGIANLNIDIENRRIRLATNKELYKQQIEILKKVMFEDFTLRFQVLGYLEYEQRRQLLKEVCNENKNRLIIELASIIEDEGIRKFTVNDRALYNSEISLGQAISKEFQDLHEYAKSLLDYVSCTEGRYVLAWAPDYAIRCLLEIQPKKLFDILGKFINKLGEDNLIEHDAQYRMIHAIIVRIVESLSLNETDSKLIEVMIESDLNILRILASEWLIEMFDKLEEQRWKSYFYLFKEKDERSSMLVWNIIEQQIKVCRNKSTDNIELCRRAKSVLMEEVSDEKYTLQQLHDRLDILKVRSISDLGEVIKGIVDANVIDEDISSQYLVDVFMENYESVYLEKKRFWYIKDIEVGCYLVHLIASIKSEAIIELKQRMEKVGRKVIKDLERAFLKNLDYTKWKYLIDLCCCLVCLDLEIASISSINAGRYVERFYTIVCNYEETLYKYSEVYKYLMEYKEHMCS